MNKANYLLLCFFALALSANAQDAIYSQFYTAPLQLNPAFTGNTYAPHIALNFRDQWHGYNQAYQTFSASYDQFIKGLNSGIGFNVQTDKAGAGLYSKNQFGANFAYRLRVKDDYFIKMGMEFGAIQSTLDWNSLVFLDQIDPTKGVVSTTQETPPADFSRTYFDASTGFLLYNSRYYFGVGLKHLNTPDESFFGINKNLNTGLPMRTSVTAGMQITLEEGRNGDPGKFISPNILFVSQAAFKQINVGAYAGLGAVFGGVWYRHNFSSSDAVIGQIGLQKGFLKVGYSHDVTLNGLTGTLGAHEISIIVNFDALSEHKGTDYNDCFKIFR
ncbi:MAG: hypothetical protein RLZZ292_4000 [Bacteroidota bacterium]|jgi:type IX secretion system PorP/SprF family membrane protein